MTEHNSPAFPTKQPLSSDFLGLTMLDHFAGLAMQGIMANPEFDLRSPMPDVASVVYKMANEMLKERQKWIK